MRDPKRGFWDETFAARVLGVPPLSAEDEYFAEEESDPPCNHDELYEAMNKLTARQAFVLRLHYGLQCQAYTVGEIASIAGWHHSTVQEHLEAGVKRLRKLLETPRDDAY